MKQVNDVVGYSNLRIVQDNAYFKFSLESVLLPNFIRINNKVNNILDLCTGNAPIPLIVSKRTNAHISAVEIQKEVYNLAVETVNINNLNEQITLINDDIKNLGKYFEYESFDLITCNPPYFKNIETSLKNKENIKAIARHEICITLCDLVDISSRFLRFGGSFVMVHRSERFDEVLQVLLSKNLTPKRVRFIYSDINSSSILFMVEAVKGGRCGLIVEKPLIIYDSKNVYTNEVQKIVDGDL